MQTEDIRLLDTINTVILPAFVSGVVPIFNLPPEMRTLHNNVAEVTKMKLPPLYPLKLDLETMSRIFLGNLTSVSPHIKQLSCVHVHILVVCIAHAHFHCCDVLLCLLCLLLVVGR